MTWKTSPAESEVLAGLRVLIVEDEPLIAMEMQAALAEQGVDVVGPGRDLDENLQLARGLPLAAALLDVRLGPTTVAPLAEALHDLGVPFAFYTGQTEFDAVRRRWPQAPVVQKPSPTRELVTVLESLCRH